MCGYVRCIIGLLAVFSACTLTAQAYSKALESIEQVRNSVPSIERDSVLVHNYNYLAEANSGSNDSLARRFLDTLEVLKQESLWSKSEGLYFRALGKYHDRRGEFQEALSAYSIAIESLQKAGDQSEYIVYATILKAFVLNNNGLHDECLRLLATVKPLAEALENKNCLAWIIDAFGDYYFYSGFGHQDFHKALQYYLEVEEILPQVKNQAIVADNAHCLSGCYIRLGQEQKALEYRDKALSIANANGFKNIIFAVYADLADVYEEKGEFQKAIEYRQLSLDFAKQANWIEMEARAERNISYTYRLAGDYQNAFTHYERLNIIEDSLSRFDVQERYAELQTKYESGRKDLEIERLKGHSLLMLRNTLAVLLILGIVFLIYYTRVNKRLKRQNLELLRKHEEILAAHSAGQNLERKRMAAELHDNINAKIAATKWILETLHTEEKSPEERAMIESLVRSMGEIYEDVRFISHNLVPKDIESKSLDELVLQLVENLNQNQKIRFRGISAGTPVEINNALKLQVYSMLMELVNNSIKHSGCANCTISLHYHRNRIDLEVSDDGAGFDVSAEHQGAGLRNVRSRAEYVKGNMEITTNKTGTSIQIQIPLGVSSGQFRKAADPV